MKADLFFGRLGWRDEFLDRIEHNCELLVIFLLQRFDFPSKVTVCVHQPPELHEGAHNGDVHFHRASAAEHAREHGDALLGECVRAVAAPPRPFFEITVCDLKDSYSLGVS